MRRPHSLVYAFPGGLGTQGTKPSAPSAAAVGPSVRLVSARGRHEDVYFTRTQRPHERMCLHMQRASHLRGVSRSTANLSFPAVRSAHMYTLRAPIASTCRDDEPDGAWYTTAAKKAAGRPELLGIQKLPQKKYPYWYTTPTWYQRNKVACDEVSTSNSRRTSARFVFLFLRGHV